MASLLDLLLNRQKEAKDGKKEDSEGSVKNLRKALRKRSGVDISEDGMPPEDTQDEEKK